MSDNKKTTQETELELESITGDEYFRAATSGANWKQKYDVFNQWIRNQIQIDVNGANVITYNLKVPLSSLQLQNLNSSPVDIGLPAPGMGYVYRVTQFDIKCIFGSINWLGGVFGIKASGSDNIQFNNIVFSFNEDAFFLGTTWRPVGSANVSPLIENDTLFIVSENDSTGYDGTGDAYITVQKVKL